MEKVKLFQVKDICKICKVTRKALLIYEKKGLLTPYYVNQDSGYRYYNAENVSKIMHIRRFQSFGFSLDEICEYLRDTKKMMDVLLRLKKMRDELESTITELRMRVITDESDKEEITEVTLPKCYCYAKKKLTHDYYDALDFLRETHLEAIATEKADKLAKMYTSVLSYEGEAPDVYGTCEMLYCIPMVEGYSGKNAYAEEATRAVSLFHRGSYRHLVSAAKTVMDYCKKNGLTPTGPMRFIWLEGPPVHGADEDMYLTQIVVPIK